jgi:aspartate aminotransferase
MPLLLEDHLSSIVIPANLRINDQINQYRKQCAINGCSRPYFHFAFGQSPFSPPAKIIQALREHANKHDYLPTAGLPELRESIALYYQKIFGLDCEAKEIVISPGSKEMLSMLLATLQGSILIPSPSWVSYLPQAKILKKDVISLKLTKEDNYKLTPESLKHGIEHTHTNQRILILNNPNNPTGAVYSAEELEALVHVCRKYNVVVISDEIYARTSFQFEKYRSMATIYPEGTIVTGGLSKDRSAGGYRLGVGVFPKDSDNLVQDILKIAGSTYSCVAAPVQYASITAYSMDKDIESYMDDCANIHHLVGKKTASLLSNIPGVKTTNPQGAFYLYVDFNDYRDNFFRLGFNTCSDFCEHLIKVEHTALLPGESLLLLDDEFGVRVSYVDYDGDKLLDNWKAEKPSNAQEEEKFFMENCPSIENGVKGIHRYIDQIKNNKMPEHI